MVRWPLVGLTWIALLSGSAQPAPHDDEIVANDNRTPAGVHRGGSLAVRLVAARGIWYPEEREGPAHEVYAFGEEGRGLSNPGPLLRVTVGTEIEATIHNRIPGATLHLHGLHNRPGKPTVLIVPAGKTRSIRFRAGAPGTYFYWATTRGAGQLRDRFGMESQLTGAFIVDPPGPRPPDHVFVIGIEDDSAAIPALRHIRAAVVNGRSWPHSETATVAAGDTVRMRWINASDRLHPMHLHGFYFTVDSHGDIAEDTLYDAARKRLAVTELLRQGQTFSLTWVPERPGNWLMHCHMAEHMSPHLRGAPPVEHGSGDMPNHALKVMAGLVTGWRVLPSAHSSPASRPDPPRPLRRMRLLVQETQPRQGIPAYAFVVQSGAAAGPADSATIPGRPIVLTRGEPVQITVVNRLEEPTSVHWHGIELDSYFDGVSGWSGEGGRIAPPVGARDSFVVRFTPPRAGTFIYHSHFDEERQLSSGLYGPMIVLEPGTTYDPVTDRSWVLSQRGSGPQLAIMLNGSTTPAIDLVPKQRYRIRLINICPNMPLVFSVLADSVPIKWRAVAKDGADLPPNQAVSRPARLTIGVGEAYDFELASDSARDLHLQVTDPAGRLRLSGLIRIR